MPIGSASAPTLHTLPSSTFVPSPSPSHASPATPLYRTPSSSSSLPLLLDSKKGESAYDPHVRAPGAGKKSLFSKDMFARRERGPWRAPDDPRDTLLSLRIGYGQPLISRSFF